VSDDVSLPPGTVYRNDANWTGWIVGDAGPPVAPSNGVLSIAGSGNWVRLLPGIDIAYRTVMIRARWTGSSAPQLLRLSTTPGVTGLPPGQAPNRTSVLTREWEWFRIDITRPDLPISLIRAHPNINPMDAFEVSDIFILEGFADDWHDTPPPMDASQFLWMTRADFRGTEQLTDWSPPVRITGPAGPQGINAIYLNLDNENHSVAADSQGAPAQGALPFTVQATIFDGTQA